VSQYAAKLYFHEYTPELNDYFRAAPMLGLGWVAKMEVLHLISTGALRLWDETNDEEVWKTACVEGGRVPLVERITDHHDVTLYDTYPAGTWLFPNAWNGGLFDCIQIVGDTDKTVKVVQITSSKTPSFWLAQLNAYLHRLDAARVDFVFVCPRAHFDDLVLPALREASLSVPICTARGGLLRLGLDYFLTANATMEIEVRKLCYEELRAPIVKKRLRKDEMLEPNCKK